MKLKATLKAPRLNIGAFKRQLQERLGDAVTQATFEWLNATTAKIPVWSGASMATFQPLASRISLNLAISPVVSSRIPLGLANGEGEIEADGNAGRFTFKYRTTLRHLIYNEHNNANLVGFHLTNPGPYQFQETGQEAFRRFAESIRLPDPFRNLTVKTIRAG